MMGYQDATVRRSDHTQESMNNNHAALPCALTARLRSFEHNQLCHITLKWTCPTFICTVPDTEAKTRQIVWSTAHFCCV